MTDPSSHGSNAAENIPEQQSLTQIEGIGKVKKKWLESVGIHTLQELAEAKAEEVETQLSAEGHTAHASEVERWITQAQELIAELDAPDPETSAENIEPASSESSSGEEETSESEAVTEPATPEATATSEAAADVETVSAASQTPEDWQTFAAFAVEFQSQQEDDDVRYRTLVRHLATNQEETWSGIEEKNLQSWLRSQVAEVIPSEPSAEDETIPDSDMQLTLDIENLFILQPPSTASAMELYKPNMMFPSPISGNLPFSLVIQFGVQEQDVLAKLRTTVSYQVECYARSLKGGDSISLGELPSTELVPQNEPYIVYLPAISLSKGIYRLQVFLSLQGMQALPVFIEVPVLQVT